MTAISPPVEASPVLNAGDAQETSNQALEQALFERISEGIERQGYVVLPSALPETVTDSLLEYLAVIEEQRFHAAAIGRGQDQVRNQFVRRDRIFWIDERHEGSTVWLGWSARLKRYLNRHLFLGLFSFESHFSYYSGE